MWIFPWNHVYQDWSKLGKMYHEGLIYQDVTIYWTAASAHSGLPTDLWIPATRQFPPQKTHVFLLGYHHQEKWLNISIEGFYKMMTGLVGYEEWASYSLGRETWEDLVATNTGEAYGIEFFGEKNFGKLSGWTSYALSRNIRHFLGIDDAFPYKYDRRQNFSFSGIYHYNQRINLSVIWLHFMLLQHYAPPSAVLKKWSCRRDSMTSGW